MNVYIKSLAHIIINLQKDKNKELEAKNAKLERQLAEERAKIRKLTKSLGQTPAEGQVQVTKKDTATIANSMGSNAKKSCTTDKTVDNKKSDSSVDSSSLPKQPDGGQNRGELTPTKQNKQFVEDDHSQKGIAKFIDCNDSASHCTAGSLPNSPRPCMMPEASSLSITSDVACNLFELSNAENSSQPVAVVNGFDPLAPVPTGVALANGTAAVVVPVLVPTPPLPEKEIKRFDPLGTPKRSGSKVTPNSGLQAYSELNGNQQLSAYAVPPIEGGIPAVAMPFVTAAPIVQQPPLTQQQHQMNSHPPVQNQQTPDPFDEIALRHGGSQAT